VSRHPARVERERKPQFEVIVRHPTDSGRDSDDGEAVAVHVERLAENVGVAAESAAAKGRN
jgi:hypothetical protein